MDSFTRMTVKEILKKVFQFKFFIEEKSIWDFHKGDSTNCLFFSSSTLWIQAAVICRSVSWDMLGTEKATEQHDAVTVLEIFVLKI